MTGTNHVVDKAFKLEQRNSKIWSVITFNSQALGVDVLYGIGSQTGV